MFIVDISVLNKWEMLVDKNWLLSGFWKNQGKIEKKKRLKVQIVGCVILKNSLFMIWKLIIN